MLLNGGSVFPLSCATRVRPQQLAVAFMKHLQLLQALEQMMRTKRRQSEPCETCDQSLLPCNPLIADDDASLDFR